MNLEYNRLHLNESSYIKNGIEYKTNGIIAESNVNIVTGHMDKLSCMTLIKCDLVEYDIKTNNNYDLLIRESIIDTDLELKNVSQLTIMFSDIKNINLDAKTIYLFATKIPTLNFNLLKCEKLKIYNNPFKDIIGNETSLTQLILSNCDIEELNLTGYNLKLLNLNYNKLKKINVVAPKLKTLLLFNNLISEFSDKNYPKLNSLNLSNNLISYTKLNNEYKELSLINNPLIDINEKLLNFSVYDIYQYQEYRKIIDKQIKDRFTKSGR